MADEVDIATANQEVIMQSLIANRKEPNKLQPKGFCHYCGTKTENPKQLYCDAECASDHHRELKIKGLA